MVAESLRTGTLPTTGLALRTYKPASLDVLVRLAGCLLRTRLGGCLQRLHGVELFGSAQMGVVKCEPRETLMQMGTRIFNWQRRGGTSHKALEGSSGEGLALRSSN